MDCLKAVFWDYPQFTNRQLIRQILQDEENQQLRSWLLQRFLEHGRAVDTFEFFSPEVIARELPGLKLRPYTSKKWKRLVEIYAGPCGR